jgi:hypothetical protein
MQMEMAKTPQAMMKRMTRKRTQWVPQLGARQLNSYSWED